MPRPKIAARPPPRLLPVGRGDLASLNFVALAAARAQELPELQGEAGLKVPRPQNTSIQESTLNILRMLYMIQGIFLKIFGIGLLGFLLGAKLKQMPPNSDLENKFTYT